MQSLQEVLLGASEAGRPFWSALAQGRLELPWCRACARHFFFPRRICPRCWSEDIGWVPSAGRGTVFSLTVAHMAFQGVHKEELPYATGLVDLEEEGVRLPARFALDALPAIGDAVVCSFRDGAGRFPVFVPADREEGS